GCCPDERYSTDVNLFDHVGFGLTRRHCFGKWIEIDDDEVNRGHVKSAGLFFVNFVSATEQDSAKDRRVKRLDAAAENGGIPCERFNRGDGMPEFLDEGLGTTRGNKGCPVPGKLLDDGLEFLFVKNRNQYSGDFSGHAAGIESAKLSKK